MFFKRKKSKQPTLKLIYVGDDKYYIEGFVPVSIINDMSLDGLHGYRIITLKRDGSNHVREFMLKWQDKHKDLKHKNGVRGIILRKFGGK